jgi:hypothetical protein
MKSKIDFRQASISGLSALLSALLLGLAGVFDRPLNWTYFLVFFFVGLGMLKFVTEVFNIISPVQARQADLKDEENKAIVADAFNQSKSQH